jgi:hypothetical protein
LREAAGVDSFADISRKTGFSDDRVSNYMQGGGWKMPAEFIVRFCEVYGVDPSWILTEKLLPREGKPGAEGEHATAACPNGKLCDTLPRFVAQLAVILEEAVSADPDVRRRAAATIRTASSMLEEVFRALPETRRDAVGS